jgi:chemotaxis response regulator CheB
VTPKLSGKSVLVLEPDDFMSGYISAVLADHGAKVIAPRPTPQQCVTLLEQTALDAVVFSLDDESESSLAYAAVFRQFDTPLLFVSVNRTATVPIIPEKPHLRKPFAAYQVVDELALMIAHRMSVSS